MPQIMRPLVSKLLKQEFENSVKHPSDTRQLDRKYAQCVAARNLAPQPRSSAEDSLQTSKGVLYLILDERPWRPHTSPDAFRPGYADTRCVRRRWLALDDKKASKSKINSDSPWHFQHRKDNLRRTQARGYDHAFSLEFDGPVVPSVPTQVRFFTPET